MGFIQCFVVIVAQKSGIVEHPPLSLPAEEWVKRKRSTQYGKSIQHCAIFRKEFASQPRVYLYITEQLDSQVYLFYFPVISWRKKGREVSTFGHHLALNKWTNAVINCDIILNMTG